MEQAVLQREEFLRVEAVRALYLKVQAELLQFVEAREEAKRAEAERLEAERAEAERLEAERIEAAEKTESLRLRAVIKQAEFEKEERERPEVEKADALMLAELEAKKAEAAGKAPMISDPRVAIMEKSLEEIKAEQKFKEVLEK